MVGVESFAHRVPSTREPPSREGQSPVTAAESHKFSAGSYLEPPRQPPPRWPDGRVAA